MGPVSIQDITVHIYIGLNASVAANVFIGVTLHLSQVACDHKNADTSKLLPPVLVVNIFSAYDKNR